MIQTEFIHVAKLEMLAERKSKQKWSQDPRNTFWSKDKSKFGYRMLEQMGWSEDQGLGRHGQGCKEHLKVSRKRDNSGIGSKRGRDDDWIQHQDTFDQILANLNGGCGQDHSTSSKSIIESAKESKRIVYKRFLRSKDLSAATSKEMDCVLGRKRRHSRQDTEKVSSEVDSLPEASALSTSHGITTIKRTQSVNDYFSEKMSKLKKKRTEHKTE